MVTGSKFLKHSITGNGFCLDGVSAPCRQDPDHDRAENKTSRPLNLCPQLYLFYTDLFCTISRSGGFTTAVDRYPEGKSPYGCFDMAGNTWEWTSTRIVAAKGAERGKTVNVIRGGSWDADKDSCRTCYRGEGRRAQGCYNSVGFRLVAVGKNKTLFVTGYVVEPGLGTASYQTQLRRRQMERKSEPESKSEREPSRTRSRKDHSFQKRAGPSSLH